MAYPNRTDLQNPAKKVAVQAAKGQTYGKSAAQMESQRAVPMGPSPPAMQPQSAPKRAIAPGGLGNFSRPTDNPNEPLTAGANFGPGPNAMQAGIPLNQSGSNNVLSELTQLYHAFPNDDLADLIDSYTQDGF